jgi:hypothetical protein
MADHAQEAVALLGVDPAAFSGWKYRGLAPAPEPSYFRGSVQVYRLDRIAGWLAQRQGKTYDQEAAWAEALWRSIHPMEGEAGAPILRERRVLVGRERSGRCARDEVWFWRSPGTG